MRSVAVVATLLLLPLLAGCAEPQADPGPAAAAPSVITDPRDLANGTAPGSHVHDYWGGRDRIAVLAAEGSVWSECSGSCANGMDGASERPAEGIIVPQGTRWVNGTFTFTPGAENDATAYELWVKTAADAEAKPVAGLEPGVPFSLDSTREQNDPPHYVLSLWEFRVLARGRDGGVTFRGDYGWEVEAVRGLPLDAYPPHPDRWNGQTRLDLVDSTMAAALVMQQNGGTSGYFCTNCLGSVDMPDGMAVPYDASRLEARLSGNFAGLSVSYHGANTWDLATATGTLEAPEMVFDIPLEPGMADSPYAVQSLWQFYVTFDQTSPEPRAWSGAVTLKVSAHLD